MATFVANGQVIASKSPAFLSCKTVSGYEDIFFNYSIDLDLNNSGTNDEFLRFEDLGSGTWSLAFTATSANNLDGQLWQNSSVSYTGQAFT